MRIRLNVVLVLIHAALACTPGDTSRQTISVFCAASLRPAIEEIKRSWELENDSKVIINAASTGTLARQIEYGAPADIFVSANEEWMQYLANADLLTSKPIFLAANRLVIAGHNEVPIDTISITSFATLEEITHGRITIADPGHAPLGKYTLSALQYYGVDEKVRENWILAKDARNTLRILELQEADVGMLYYSDAISSQKVKILSMLPTESHPPIRYNAALVAEPNRDMIQFLHYMEKGRPEVWQEMGFKVNNK